MLKQKAKKNNLILIILFSLVCISVFLGFGISTLKASAETNNGTLIETVYVDNTPWPKDWKHEIYRTDKTKTYMKSNLSGWVKKDSDHDIPIQYTKSVSGTISYTVSGTQTVEASTLNGALSASSSLNQSLGYSYTTTTMCAFTWTVSPTDEGNYFCIAVNYKTRLYNIKHYLQEFKWFGQGPYNYSSTTTVEIPTASYLSKNYRYEIDGATYEK